MGRRSYEITEENSITIIRTIHAVDIHTFPGSACRGGRDGGGVSAAECGPDVFWVVGGGILRLAVSRQHIEISAQSCD